VGNPFGGLLGATCVAAVSAAAIVFAQGASADTALWVHGATRSDIPESVVLNRVPPGYTLQEVDYPGGLWPWTGLTTTTGAQSIAVGVPALDEAIYALQGQGRTLVIGESLGSLVVDQEMRNLAGRPDAPDPATLSFQVVADPSRPGGLISYLPVGAYDLITGTVIKPVPETPYDVTVIKLQYDAIASWPDRPWHLLSVLNAILGGILYHGTDHYSIAAQAVINGQVPAENIRTSVNSLGGVTTTYTVQQKPAFLHLLEPYFPSAVAEINKVLTPLVNLGYSELTPDAGPHLAPGGQLVGKDGKPVFQLQPRTGGVNSDSPVRPIRSAKVATPAIAATSPLAAAKRPAAAAQRAPARQRPSR
jgi:hypothetical protein